MCLFSAPKIPATPPIPERQAVQAPQTAIDKRTGLNSRLRRGFWASIMTSPQGVAGGAPRVTGTPSTGLGT